MASDTPILCRHCGRKIWWMGEYQGWVHVHSWASVCDTSTHGPCAEPGSDEKNGSSE